MNYALQKEKGENTATKRCRETINVAEKIVRNSGADFRVRFFAHSLMTNMNCSRNDKSTVVDVHTLVTLE